MATIIEALQSLSAYPIDETFIEVVLVNRGIDSDMPRVDASTLNDSAFKLAKADIYIWLSKAPTISQGGVSYSLSAEEKAEFKRLASLIYQEEEGKKSGVYGYKGQYL